ncbi:hypothetical protein Q5P01_018346 [Channa striata]|uniref:NTF2 domain-containing protein n=1 Tax=Channa striata TaxID=64152 RepID=A0AA88M4L8_CHASR|nr:hypothetical protein Q5P01_018346 [Channa striata]
MEHHRIDRVGILSPLEESSAEISRDSGIVSQSASSLSMVSEILSSGTVSQSPSFGAAANVILQSPSLDEAAESGTSEQQEDEVLRNTAVSYSSYIRATAGEEIMCLEKSLEEMLTRVDEFVGMLDMIRNDTSQIVNENLPQIQQKSTEMRQIYRRIDKLEAFVKMVAANVNAMEDQVTQAEGDLGTLPGAFKKILRTMSTPGFLNKPASPRRPAAHQHQGIPSEAGTRRLTGSSPRCVFRCLKKSKASHMACEKEIWQKIGEGFVREYYNQFDNTNRMGLGNLYSPDACLTWEGSPFQGREAITGKLVNLPFKRIKHIITEQDFQPTIDSCILIMVFGQLQVDEDPPMAFHQVFMLKSQNCAWACTNDVFRLGIHNIPV